MLKPPLPLTALSEAQRAQAQERFEIIRRALEEGVTQAQVARTHKIPASTVQSWIKRYRDKGFIMPMRPLCSRLTAALFLRGASKNLR